MFKKRNILAAVDIDQHAELIVQRAFQFAQIQGSNLIITHIVDYQSGFEVDHIPFHTPAQISASMIQIAQYWLLDLIQRLNIRAVIIVEAGGICENIITFVSEFDVGCVFIGSPKPFFSAVNHLEHNLQLKTAQCQVLTVPHCYNNLRFRTQFNKFCAWLR